MIYSRIEDIVLFEEVNLSQKLYDLIVLSDWINKNYSRLDCNASETPNLDRIGKEKIMTTITDQHNIGSFNYVSNECKHFTGDIICENKHIEAGL